MSKSHQQPSQHEIEQAIDLACRRVAPSWPLDRFIAVNPYWGWVDQPIDDAFAQIAHLTGSSMHLPRSEYLSAWNAGSLQHSHIAQALAEGDVASTPENVISNLKTARKPIAGLPLLCDIVDTQRNLIHEPAWQHSITHQISQFCAAYFDHDQADWRPSENLGLFGGWREAIQHDRGIAIFMHAPDIAGRAHQLPIDAQSSIAWVLNQLQIDQSNLEDYLSAVLLRMQGWAAWCAYQRWQARLQGKDDAHIVDLLAIRLAWEFLIDDGLRGKESTWSRWIAMVQAPKSTYLADMQDDAIARRALEIAFQNDLAKKLACPPAPATATATTNQARVQAAFCIDVRSEVFRRAWETIDPQVQTKGFAGFFGLPIDYAPLGTTAMRPQLPGLLAPAMSVTETTGNPQDDAAVAAMRRASLEPRRAWQLFQRTPGTSFTLIENLGIGYLGKLIQRSLPSTKTLTSFEQDGLPRQHTLRPMLAHKGTAEAKVAQIDLAYKILTAMDLTHDFARLVLLIGHGSSSSNNPHASGLDCGACCGQTGEVNARTLAILLNDLKVRQGLIERGVPLNSSSHFIAALHNTTTDEVTLFDRDLVPASHANDLAEVSKMLVTAGCHARAERAEALGLGELSTHPKALLRELQQRTNDWAQTRPEWGLANNAALIVAPRARSRGINLAGRAFLHDYDWRTDQSHSVLELIMTAPMVVANWINMQYFASTVDNQRYGSGNKVLHNVVGGRIGVFEGNGGDLRIGLPLQSLHNGEKWMHTPLRLSVYIEAPRAGIEQILSKHALVRHLVNNRWLFLFRIDSVNNAVESYSNGGWH